MYPGLVPLIYEIFTILFQKFYGLLRLRQNVSGEGLRAFVASSQTWFRVNFILINLAEWPHLRSQFGMHPGPVPEFYRNFTILCMSWVLWPFIGLCQNVSGEGLGACQLCPPRQNWRVDFRIQSDPTHVGIVSCGGRTGRIHGVRAMWDSRANGETPMVGLLAGYIGNWPYAYVLAPRGRLTTTWPCRSHSSLRTDVGMLEPTDLVRRSRIQI